MSCCPRRCAYGCSAVQIIKTNPFLAFPSAAQSLPYAVTRQPRQVPLFSGTRRKRPLCSVTQADTLGVVLEVEIRYHLVENMQCSMSITIPKTMRAGIAVLVLAATPLAAQTAPHRAPRAAGGKPDLNGICQAVNEANYDLDGHSARAAMALRPGPLGPVPAAQVLALGAVGAVPPSMGVVEGGEIPYKPEALAK